MAHVRFDKGKSSLPSEWRNVLPTRRGLSGVCKDSTERKHASEVAEEVKEATLSR